MHSNAYIAMSSEMGNGNYTEVEAKNTLTSMYAKKMLTDDEYTELMEAAGKLSANTDTGQTNARITAVEDRVKALEDEMALVKKALEDGGTVLPEPEPGPDGSEDNPIDAYRGMTYTKDLYYRDSEDGQVYKCFRDNDASPGTGVRLDYLPHELVNIYFYFVRVS